MAIHYQLLYASFATFTCAGDDAMLNEIKESFGLNLARVRNLITIYEEVTGEGRGRRGVEHTDLLRAAVVLLHAALEEFLREVQRWKLVGAGKEHIQGVPLKGISPTGRPEKFWLGDLVAFRGKTVDAVIAESVDELMEKSNYNDLGDVAKVLSLAGVNNPIVDQAKATLAAPMSRRHKIVHQADRQEQPGKGYGPTTPIDKPTVIGWIDAVERFVVETCKHL